MRLTFISKLKIKSGRNQNLLSQMVEDFYHECNRELHKHRQLSPAVIHSLNCEVPIENFLYKMFQELAFS
jgi:hypothetical protein